MLEIADLFERLTKRSALGYENVLTEPLRITLESDPSDPTQLLWRTDQKTISTPLPTPDQETATMVKAFKELLLLHGYDPDLDYAPVQSAPGQYAILPEGEDPEAYLERQKRQQLITPPAPPTPAAVPPKKRRRKKEVEPEPEGMPMPLVGPPGMAPTMQYGGPAEVSYKGEPKKRKKKKEPEPVTPPKRRTSLPQFKPPPEVWTEENPRYDTVADAIEARMKSFLPAADYGDPLISSVVEMFDLRSETKEHKGEGWDGTPILTVNIEGKNYIYSWAQDAIEDPGRWGETPTKEPGYELLGSDPFIIKFSEPQARQKKWSRDRWVNENRDAIFAKDKRGDERMGRLQILNPGDFKDGRAVLVRDRSVDVWYQRRPNGFYSKVDHSTVETSREELQPFGRVVGTNMFDEGQDISPSPEPKEASWQRTFKVANSFIRSEKTK